MVGKLNKINLKIWKFTRKYWNVVHWWGSWNKERIFFLEESVSVHADLICLISNYNIKLREADKSIVPISNATGFVKLPAVIPPKFTSNV